MTFSSDALSLLIYGALIWCALSAAGLSAMLLIDLMKGQSW